ncbi:MAG: hypothetical protein IPM46_14820 [Flavobacteriales bacterium]|nr:hypothetical protein [Flavobacteriales bacterium]
MRTRLAIPLTGLLLLASCGGDRTGEATQGTGGELVIGGEQGTVAALYQMPTPNELFGLVRQLAGDGHKRLLAPASNAGTFVSLRGRALNFGVYATDLVYASSFKLNVEVARYYLASKKLAEGLGLSSAFTDADFIRLESNLTRGDSLEMISNEAYLRAYERMQQEEMGPVLALVLAGGWMESMHLVIRQIDAFGQSDALMARVAEQKVTLEHLIGLMDAFKDDQDVAAVQAQLIGLRDIYDRLNVTRAPHQGESSSGRMILGDDVIVELTGDQYKELSAEVGRLRTEWTKPENANAQ